MNDDIQYIGDDSLADKVRMPFQETLLLRTRFACISVACVGVLRVVIFRLVCTIVNHGPPSQRFMIDTYVLSIRQQLYDLHVSRKLPAKGVQRAGGILSTIAVISRGRTLHVGNGLYRLHSIIAGFSPSLSLIFRW